MRSVILFSAFILVLAVTVNAYPAPEPEPEPLDAEQIKEFLKSNSGKLMEGLKKGGKFLSEQFNKLKNMAGKKQREARQVEFREEREAPDLKPSANADYIVIELPKPQVHYYAAEVQKETEEAAAAA